MDVLHCCVPAVVRHCHTFNGINFRADSELSEQSLAVNNYCSMQIDILRGAAGRTRLPLELVSNSQFYSSTTAVCWESLSISFIRLPSIPLDSRFMGNLNPRKIKGNRHYRVANFSMMFQIRVCSNRQRKY